MKILPLKSEVEAALAVMNSDGFEDSPSGDFACAKAVVKALWAEFAKRDSFFVQMKLSQESDGLLFGPLLYKDEAIRFAESLPGASKGFKVQSAATQMERMEALEQEAKDQNPQRRK
jgi:hypothetical protein